MMFFFIFIGVMVLYFGFRIWRGSRNMEFYGDSINKGSKNVRDEAYQKSAQHSQQSMNANNQTGGGGGPTV
jgi:hypothetical protein